MNRIVLVGNGFDLALKLKTSYNNFAWHYLYNAFLKGEKDTYNDNLISVYKKPTFHNGKKLLTEFKTIKCFNDNSDTPSSNNGFNYVFNTKESLVELLLNENEDNQWGDIEHIYYKALCKFAKTNNLKSIKKLNIEFEELQKHLHDYLLQEQEHFNSNARKHHLRDIQDLIDQLIKPIDKKQNLPNKILFLNFNYTNSIEFFVNGMTDSLRKKTNILYLHGQLNNQSNKMIFGYGDEQDENFKLLEKYDDCLKFVKGYKYLHTNTYKNFLNFIENDDYEVFTLGHSCNLSDKTMLSELFNNSRCKKIKILTYVKSNELDGLHSTNYNEVCYAIGRVFSNKGDLRRKVITYNKEDVLCLSRKYKPEVIS